MSEFLFLNNLTVGDFLLRIQTEFHENSHLIFIFSFRVLINSRCCCCYFFFICASSEVKADDFNSKKGNKWAKEQNKNNGSNNE